MKAEAGDAALGGKAEGEGALAAGAATCGTWRVAASMHTSDTHTDRARGKKVRQCSRTSACPTLTAQHTCLKG